jgi:hypothetical protein
VFERSTRLDDVVYAPWDGEDPDRAVRLAVQWFRQQPGDGLVLLHAKKMIRNNPLLARLVSGALVEKPDTVWRSGWQGGPVLAPWPSEQVLGALSDELAHRATAVCIIEWGEEAYQQAWLAGHGARSLVTGEVAGAAALLPPVVEVAMRHLGIIVNHNNGLVQEFDKAYAVGTLQELVRGGHRFDVDQLCAWALANGFTDREVVKLGDYATRILAGRTFRLRTTAGPRRGIVREWEAEAAGQA